MTHTRLNYQLLIVLFTFKFKELDLHIIYLYYKTLACNGFAMLCK
jgi:hypothetical protein